MTTRRSHDETISRGLLWHPVFGPRTFDGGRFFKSLANLRGEQALLQALAGVLSGLAAIEAAGEAIEPMPADWALAEDGLPVIAEEPGEPPEGEHLARHLLLFMGLFGGRAARDGKSIVIPKRHPHHEEISGWFSRWCADRFSARDALLDLLELQCVAGTSQAALPCEWGCSATWTPSGSLRSPGLGEVRVEGRSALAALSWWCASQDYKRIMLPGASYPFSGLEPLAREALNCAQDEARAWLSSRCAKPAAMAAELKEAVQPSAWCLWPKEALDEASLSVLAEMAKGLTKPLIVAGNDAGAEQAGAFSDVHALWLPSEGDRWSRAIGRALFADDGNALLLAVETLPPFGLGTGKGLLLPLSLDGREHQHLDNAGEDHPIGLWREAAAKERAGNKAGAAEARAKAFLYIGQTEHACSQIAMAEAAGLKASRAALLRAKAFEKEMNYSKAAKAINGANSDDLSAGERLDAMLTEGISLWIGGLDETGGLSLLQRATEFATTSDDRARSFATLATVMLRSGQLYEADRLLGEAKAAVKGKPTARTNVLWHYNCGIYQRKLGKYEEAADHFMGSALAASEAMSFREEAASLAEAGDALRLALHFEEAGELLARAQEGCWTLGFKMLRESARFNRVLCDLESGRLLKAQMALERSIESQKGSLPLDQAIDHYWLSRVLYSRGDLPAALSAAQKGLSLTKGTGNSEVEAPLVVVEARLLMATHDSARFSRRIEALKEIANGAPDPDDRLEAAAVLVEASLRIPSALGARERRSAEEAAEKATALAKARWLLAQARAAGEGKREPLLRNALDLAKDSRALALETEILWDLYKEGALPACDEKTTRRISAFLSENRIRGPWRDLLSAFEKEARQQAPDVQPSASPEGTGLALLERAMAGDSSLEAVLAMTGARAAAAAKQGGAVSLVGDASGGASSDLQRFAGRTGMMAGPESGGWILGVEGKRGVWYGFFWDASSRPEDSRTRLARLWAALAKPPGEASSSNEIEDSAAAKSIILGDTPVMSSLRVQIAKAAGFSFPVLVTGEPGTGKEVCARAIHLLSNRRNREWVPANGANLSPALATSLLFGHKRGAFTGADKDSQGLVESARGGSLFLDEVGELPVETQAQLLRFLQDGSYTPLGETKPRHSDARLVAATNRNLDEEAASGRFRKDLLHRLKVLCIEVPPLRDRREDIPMLFSHFFKQAADGERTACPELADEIWGPIMAYDWPGNVRELQNSARALLVASHGAGVAGPNSLPGRIRDARPYKRSGSTLRAVMEAAERRAVESAMREANGNASQAARNLGISRQALSRKLAKWQGKEGA